MAGTGVREDPTWRVKLDVRMAAQRKLVTDAVTAAAIRGCPIGEDYGDPGHIHLVNTIHAEYGVEADYVVVGTDYWATVEYGSRAHTIRSHGPYMLRNRHTGEVFGRVVHHPGTPEQPFMRPALYQNIAVWRASR